MPSSDFWRFFLSPKIQEAKQEPGYRKNNSFWEEKESHFHTPSLGPNFLSEFFYIFHFWPGSKLEVALSGKEFGFQSRRCKRGRFSHWVGKIPRRKWQLTPVFLPGKFHEQRSLVSYSPWGRRESDTTERTHCKWMILVYRSLPDIHDVALLFFCDHKGSKNNLLEPEQVWGRTSGFNVFKNFRRRAWVSTNFESSLVFAQLKILR